MKGKEGASDKVKEKEKENGNRIEEYIERKAVKERNKMEKEGEG